jgi:hypothetical protein
MNELNEKSDLLLTNTCLTKVVKMYNSQNGDIVLIAKAYNGKWHVFADHRELVAFFEGCSTSPDVNDVCFNTSNYNGMTPEEDIKATWWSYRTAVATLVLLAGFNLLGLAAIIKVLFGG